MRALGFTLVELVAVVVVMAITAAVVLPRMVGRDRREAERAARGLREALSAAARRESLTSAPVAIDFDGQGGVFTILTPVPRDAGDWSRALVWRPDPMTPPAALAPLELVRAAVDGVALPASRWRVVMGAADRRPALGLTLRSPSAGSAWTVDLLSGAVAATMTEGDSPVAGAVIDLDRTGLRDAAW